jgi:hypothetical protein
MSCAKAVAEITANAAAESNMEIKRMNPPTE